MNTATRYDDTGNVGRDWLLAAVWVVALCCLA